MAGFKFLKALAISAQRDTQNNIDMTALPAAYRKYYRENIYPLTEEFEVNRISAVEKSVEYFIIACLISFPIASFLLYGIYFSVSDDKLSNGFYVIFAVLVFVGLAYALPLMAYSHSVKKIVYPKIFAYFGPDYGYSPESGFSDDDLKYSDLIPAASSIYMEDYVRGSFNGVGIELVEATITVGSGKNKRTIFSGICVVLTMNKKFKGRTIIKRDSVLGNLFGFGIPGKYSRAVLEDPLFEKKFEVYTTDQIEARYLLSAAFMDRLLALDRIFNGKVAASFYDEKLFLMLGCDEGWFQEPRADIKVTFIDESNIIINQMSEIFKIINLLKLTDRTGL